MMCSNDDRLSKMFKSSATFLKLYFLSILQDDSVKKSSNFFVECSLKERSAMGHSSDPDLLFWTVSSSSSVPSIRFESCIRPRHVIFEREMGCLALYSRQAQDNISSQKVESLRRYQSFCVHTLCHSTHLIHGLAQGWAQARRLQRRPSRERVH